MIGEEVGRFCGTFCPARRRKKLNRAGFLAARLARQKAFPRIYLRVDLEVTRRAGVVLRRGRVICIRRVLLGPYDGRKNTRLRLFREQRLVIENELWASLGEEHAVYSNMDDRSGRLSRDLTLTISVQAHDWHRIFLVYSSSEDRSSSQQFSVLFIRRLTWLERFWIY